MFLVQRSALEHNFGYTDGNIILDILGSEEGLQESLQWLDQVRAKQAKPKTKTKRKQKKDETYQPRGFEIKSGYNERGGTI